MTVPKIRPLIPWIPCLAVLLAVLAAYANHFQNTFHFDDFHTTTDNKFIHDPHNIPRFFTNRALTSANPEDATYRPVTAASLTLDYWLGKGRPFWFHLSTFFWFELQLVLMFFLFRRIMDLADPHPLNSWTALAAVACYGLHPVCAETVNYIVQRADLYNAVGIVASLLWFIAYPQQRKRGWYLLPAVLACLAKAPALIFPFILLAYLFLFEQDAEGSRWSAAIRGALPAIAAGLVLAILTFKMTPASFDPGAGSASLYRLTQPWIALHYFQSFFLPTGLSADTDWTYVSGPFSLRALAGDLFVIALLAAAIWTARRRETRPIAFGIVWFLVTLLPTSLLPLAEVTNDHRMFFPFVGMALAVFWSLRLLLFRWKAVPVRAVAAALAVVFVAEAAGTWRRNEVWRTEESLWRDVSIKSPLNGRGLMNYGLTFVSHGDFDTALDYLRRAQALMPDYPQIELNMAITYGTMERPAEAEEHFRRAIAMADRERPDLHYYYGVWLRHWGRTGEARAELERTIRGNPYSFNARDALLQIYSEQHEWQALDAMFQDSIRMAYDEDTVRRFQDARIAFEKEQAARRAAAPTPKGQSPAALARQAAEACQAGKFDDCLAAALKAIELKPDYAEAYNNKAYALIGLQRPDEAIYAWRAAIRLKPDYTIAKNNLARALEEKRKAESASR